MLIGSGSTGLMRSQPYGSPTNVCNLEWSRLNVKFLSFYRAKGGINALFGISSDAVKYGHLAI